MQQFVKKNFVRLRGVEPPYLWFRRPTLIHWATSVCSEPGRTRTFGILLFKNTKHFCILEEAIAFATKLQVHERRRYGLLIILTATAFFSTDLDLCWILGNLKDCNHNHLHLQGIPLFLGTESTIRSNRWLYGSSIRIRSVKILTALQATVTYLEWWVWEDLNS